MSERVSEGFTIVEVLLFLAASSVLLFGAIIAIGGRQAQVQFTQGARDLESKLNDVINDVSTGFYPKNSTFSCKLDGSGNITFDNTITQQGGSSACVFLGKVLQFAPDTVADRINAFTVVGKRTGTNLATAAPKVVYDTVSNVDITEALQNQYGIRVTKVARLTAGYPAFGSIGFITKLNSSASGSGAATVDFMPVINTSLGDSKNDAVADVRDYLDDSVVNPSEGLIICLQESSGNRKAAIVIGGNNRGPTVQLAFDNNYDTAACP